MAFPPSLHLNPQGIVPMGLFGLASAMPRYALKIEYNGQPFSGWQKQKTHPSVQAEIEAALRKFEQHDGLAAAGRTDAGVHATGQVAHVDLPKSWAPFRLSEALNFHLKPQPIAITDVAEVGEEWHARFSAEARHYTFRLIARRAPIVHDLGLAWQVKKPLDLSAMQAGVQHLLGTHDFTTFRATECQAPSPIKTLDAIDIEERPYPGGQEFRFSVRARSFLHNQVRSLVGTLQLVGKGTWHPDQVKDALDARDRAACGHVSPPEGLYLSHVVYPQDPFSAES